MSAVTSTTMAKSIRAANSARKPNRRPNEVESLVMRVNTHASFSSPRLSRRSRLGGKGRAFQSEMAGTSPAMTMHQCLAAPSIPGQLPKLGADLGRALHHGLPRDVVG